MCNLLKIVNQACWRDCEAGMAVVLQMADPSCIPGNSYDISSAVVQDWSLNTDVGVSPEYCQMWLQNPNNKQKHLSHSIKFFCIRYKMRMYYSKFYFTSFIKFYTIYFLYELFFCVPKNLFLHITSHRTCNICSV